MQKLHLWRAKRAGGRITILHATGKVPHIDTIEPETIPGENRSAVVATAADGRKFELVS